MIETDRELEATRRKIQDFLQQIVGDSCRVHVELEPYEPEEEPTPPPTLEEIETVLAENIDRWNRELLEKGRQEGQAWMLLQLLHTKFGLVDGLLEERVRSADADQLLEWGKRLLSAELLEDVFKV